MKNCFQCSQILSFWLVYADKAQVITDHFWEYTVKMIQLRMLVYWIKKGTNVIVGLWLKFNFNFTYFIHKGISEYVLQTSIHMKAPLAIW